MSWPEHDPSLVHAIESRYLASVQARGSGRPSHDSTLASAIYQADPTNGGLRYKSLAPALRAELETRLMRYRPR